MLRHFRLQFFKQVPRPGNAQGENGGGRSRGGPQLGGSGFLEGVRLLGQIQQPGAGFAHHEKKVFGKKHSLFHSKDDDSKTRVRDHYLSLSLPGRASLLYRIVSNTKLQVSKR